MSNVLLDRPHELVEPHCTLIFVRVEIEEALGDRPSTRAAPNSSNSWSELATYDRHCRGEVEPDPDGRQPWTQ